MTSHMLENTMHPETSIYVICLCKKCTWKVNTIQEYSGKSYKKYININLNTRFTEHLFVSISQAALHSRMLCGMVGDYIAPDTKENSSRHQAHLGMQWRKFNVHWKAVSLPSAAPQHH